MSYSCLIGKAEANRAAVLVDLYAQIEAMGWVKQDYQPNSGSCLAADNPVDTVNETITIFGHSFVNAQHIIYSVSSGGTVIGGLTNNTLYFIVNVSGNTFKLSLTQGGAPINLSSQGVGTHSFEEGYRTYTSTGEAANQPICYLRINRVTANYITLDGYYYWNPTTHAGLGAGSLASCTIATAETGNYLWVYGNKTLFIFIVKAATYMIGMAGFLKKLFSMETTTTEAGAAGANVQISVVDNSQFIVGKKYQIYGVAQEGRDQVTVNALPTGHVQIAVLLRNYGSGAIIGEHPSTFGCYSSAANWAMINPIGAVGTAATATAGHPTPFIAITSADPDSRAQEKWLLLPWYPIQATGQEGYMDVDVMACGMVGMAAEDVYGVNQTDSGTSSGSNDATHFNDTAKAWGVNALVDKILVITAGVGVGQTREISSNTATQIIPVTPFTVTPDATSTYAIVDEAYRYFAGVLCGFAIKEVI